MRAYKSLAALVLVCFVTAIPLTMAKELRDGSSFERAIPVEGDYEHSVDWEWAYLKKRFWGHGMPKEHAFMEHNGRTFDRFVFSTPEGDKVVYFDVTRFANRIKKKH